ncbi:MAG: hypothetical protein Kow00124_05520 [Anaerolineae bacterium]
MKVLLTAGLSCTPERRPLLEELAARARAQSPDALVVAGNLGGPPEQFEAALALFNDLTCPRAVLAGNRDVWHHTGHADSQTLWETMLPRAAARHGWTWLESRNLVVDRVGICGTIGWYDYSARDHGLGYTADQYESLKGLVSDDAHYINWGWSDREFAALVGARFSGRLDALENSREIDYILVVTHFPVFQQLVPLVATDVRSRFAAAYAFNLSLARVITPKSKVRYVISGHLPAAGMEVIRFGSHSLEAHSIGMDGEMPRLLALDV